MSTLPDYGSFICAACHRRIERARPLADAISEAIERGQNLQDGVEVCDPCCKRLMTTLIQLLGEN